MKWNSLVRRIITCAVAAATIATASPAYVFAEDEAEIVAIEDENEAIVQDTEEPADVVDENGVCAITQDNEDATDAFLDEDECTFWFRWDRDAKVTVIEPAEIAGRVKAGDKISVKSGTSIRFKVEPIGRKVTSVKNGKQEVTPNADGSYSVVISENFSEIGIEMEKKVKITFDSVDNKGHIGCTPMGNDFEPYSPWEGFVYLKPNGTIRWIYKPDEKYGVTKVTKVEGSREIELKPVDRPKKEGEVGIFELKNVNKDTTIRVYSEKYDHMLKLSSASDYNSVVIDGKDVYKGDSVGFSDGASIVITGLGKGDTIDTKNWSTYFVKWTTIGDNKSGYEYGDGYKDDKIGGLYALNNLTEDIELTVQGRQIPVSAITAKGKTEGSYTVTATAASKKGEYINLTGHKADTKVAFAVKKTGSTNYEIASDSAKVRYGAGEDENITLTKEKNGHGFEIPFDTLAALAYSENPKVEFTTSVIEKLPIPAPTAKVSSTTDIDATLALGVPKSVKDPTGLWYKVEGRANVAKGKSIAEGMTGSVGPLYIPATESEMSVYLMAEEGKNPGDGAAQKYDFTATLLQLKEDPGYAGKPLTDKTAVEGVDGDNILGKSPEKKFNGTTKTPWYEDKLGLKKVKPAFILGEDEVTLATAKYSAKTTFKELELAEIKDDVSGAVVRTSDTEDESEMITIDGDTIILEDSAGLTPGGKYTLSVWPKSKTGGKNAKPATLKLTVKQNIDQLDLKVPQESYIKKANKAITIKPVVTYNGGDPKKKPAIKKVNWELLDADGNKLTDASPLFGKVTINKKNGTVTVDKGLVIPEGSTYGFMIFAKAADYADNMAEAKTEVIELTAEETKPDTKGVEVILNDISGAPEGLEKSDIEVSGVQKSGGKMYATGEEIRVRITKAGISDNWGASITAKPGNDTIQAQRDGEYACFSSDAIREKMKKAKNFQLLIYF